MPGRADHLHAGRVLGPADGVDDRRGPLAAGVVAEQLGDADELLGRAAADLGDDLGRVAGEVPPEDLQDAARVLQASGREAARRPARPSCRPRRLRATWPRPSGRGRGCLLALARRARSAAFEPAFPIARTVLAPS